MAASTLLVAALAGRRLFVASPRTLVGQPEIEPMLSLIALIVLGIVRNNLLLLLSSSKVWDAAVAVANNDDVVVAVVCCCC